ncbi:uncharacterized protein [Littorina saxatilis]|uniref:uncharacterized protein n=1 Tax=Littorina saxatilis TaxID=31220 RepID=UPI0038B5DF74
MTFHPDKCSVLTVSKKKKTSAHQYTLHGHALENVTSAKYLGVTVQADLKWDIHIDTIVKKANQTLGFLRRNLKIGAVHTKELAYKSLVRPLLEYACTAWDPSSQKNIAKIEAVQRRAARYVLHRHRNTSSVGEMLQTLQWPSLEQRRRTSRLCMLYKITNNLVKVNCDELQHLPSRSRRSSRTNTRAFNRIPSKTDTRLNSFLPRTIREWNELPEEVVSAVTAAAFTSSASHHCQHL